VQERIAASRADRRTRELAQQRVLRTVEREVFERQVANVHAIQERLDQLDAAARVDDFDRERGEAELHRLVRGAHNARAHAWRGYA
jgi:Skp family chaperone for outer membrane proteins